MAQIIGDWREPGGTPILPLQHKGYDKDRGTNGPWDLQLRAMITACRITGRDDESGGLGEWIHEPSTVGDVVGGFFWPRSSRPISGWSFAWPSITVPSSAGTASGGGNGSLPEPEILPSIWDGEQRAKPDQRWGQLAYEVPCVQGRTQRRYSKFPIGTHAVAMTATNENEQRNMLWHADPRTVAANAAGDPIMGTYMSDLNSRGEYDPDRYARYQTAWRVVRPRMSCTAGVVADPERQGRFLNAIAWNLALTGIEGAFGRGLIVDNAWGGMRPPISTDSRPPVAT